MSKESLVFRHFSVAVLLSLLVVPSLHAAVGRTPGVFAVNNGGAATYTIPIFTPPGPRGVQPSIALTYNSNAPVGYVGKGWAVSGFSAISECRKTIAQDGVTALGGGTTYCKDGNRLRLQSGSTGPWANGEWATEIADFTRVRSEWDTASRWTVETKEGLTQTYGHPHASTHGSQWLVTEIKDRSGNRVRFTYGTCINNTACPTKIEWARTSSATTTDFLYSMDFTYSSPSQLDSISVKTSGTLNRKYVLGYSTSPTTGVKRLETITECAGSSGTDCLSSTEVAYQDGGVGVSSGAYVAPGVYSISGNFDYNGDGMSDLTYNCGYSSCIRMATGGGSFSGEYSIGNPNQVAGYTSVSGDPFGNGRDVLIRANGTNVRQAYTWTGSGFSPVSTGLAVSDYAFLPLADVNGDGRDDLYAYGTYTDSYGIPAHLIQAHLSQSSGSTFSFDSTATSAGFPIAYVPVAEWYGRPIEGTATPTTWIQTSSTHPWVKEKLDANGDGKQDLLVSTYLHIQIYENWSECWAMPEGCFPGYEGYEPYSALLLSNESGTEYSIGAWALTEYANFGQFNPDGCADIVYGGTLVMSENCVVGGSQLSVPYAVRGFMDWDADGRSDFLVHIIPNSTLSVLRSTDSGLSSPESTSIPSNCGFFILDADGDGLDDAGCNTSSGIYVYLHQSPGVTPDLAVSFTDGFGVSHGVQYKVSTQEGYTSYTNATYPEQDANEPQVLVRTATSPDGIGGTYTTTYSYFGATRNLQGRGWLGFEKIESVDSRNSIKNVRRFERAFPFTGMLVEDSLYQPGGTLISTRTLTPSSATLDATSYNQRHFPYVSAITEDVYEVGGASNGNWITRTSIGNAYDNFGNLTASTRTMTDKDGNSPLYGYEWVTSTSTSFSPNTTYWCLGLPTALSVAHSTTTGEASVTRSKSFTPDYVNCRMDAEIVEPSSSTLQVNTSYGYDSFGNVSSVSVTGRNPNGTNMTARTTTTSWGTTGQFPVSVTNPLSQTTARTFHSTFGSLVSETDPNGIVVANNTHDSFGRLETENHPDGTFAVYYYGLLSPAYHNPLGADYVQKASYDSGSSAFRYDYVFRDQLGRMINEYHSVPGGGYSTVARNYDALGRVATEGAPFWSLDGSSYTPSHVTTFGYDLLGRVTHQSRPLSQGNSTAVTTTIAYAGRTQTVTDANGKNSTKILDVNGWMRRSSDHDGYYQSFGYDAAGSLKQVTDSLSNTLFTASYAYGAQAFQNATTDMDLGAWSYTYNSLGELVGWTDAESQSFSQTYDALSRMTSRTEAEGTTTWTWGTSAASKNIGRLAGVSMSGYSESFTFDGVGRPSTQTITTDQSYAIDYAYTSQGLLDTLTYPTSTSSTRVKVKYGYANGILQSVTDWTSGSAGTVYWTANTKNVRGQTTQETLGNGVVTNRSFDAVTGWLNSIQSGVSGGTGLQNLGYAYDPVGNVTQRQENTLGLTENFYYNDNLYRLTSSQVNANTPVTYGYNAMGNITNRSDVNGNATWTYHGTKKHAVATIGSGGSSFGYDDNGNMTSRAGSTIHWSSFNYPTYLATATENTTFYYGPDRQYYRQDYNGPSSAETTYYIGGVLEKVCPSSSCASGTIDWRHYIKAEGQTVAIVSRKSTSVNAVHYALEDNQGSGSTLVDSAGTGYVRQSYGAFGLPRDGSDWDGAVPSGDLTTIEGITRRGYTSHSMLGRMGLIHMNGRVYDAVTGRFLSPDPHVPSPGFTQSHNRYAYVYNNPLRFIDPSGFTCWTNDEELCDEFVYGTRGQSCRIGSLCYMETRRFWRDVAFMCGLMGPNCGFAMATPEFQEIASGMGVEQQQRKLTSAEVKLVGPQSETWMASCSNPIAGSLNPLAASYGQLTADYECGRITAEQFRETDKRQGLAVVTMVTTIGGVGELQALRAATGPLKQWLRLGPSYSRTLGEPIELSLRWGASPAGGGKYLEQIGSGTLREFNQWLRNTRIPVDSWRTADPGHLHIW